MSTLLQDIRYSCRQLRRSPGFTTVALLTLALGIGANAGMFSVVHGILLRPLPYAEPDALVRLYQVSPEFNVPQGPVSAVDLDDWRAESRSFNGMAGYVASNTTLTGDGEPIEVPDAAVTEDFFEVLGVPAQLGRDGQPRGTAKRSDQ